MDGGERGAAPLTFDIFGDITEELERQLLKWGPQDDQADTVWLTVLTEEVGESANAVLSSRPGAEYELEWLHHLRTELVQVAAVAVNWIECVDRRLA